MPHKSTLQICHCPPARALLLIFGIVAHLRRRCSLISSRALCGTGDWKPAFVCEIPDRLRIVSLPVRSI